VMSPIELDEEKERLLAKGALSRKATTALVAP